MPYLLGKIAAQCAHAAVSCYKESLERYPEKVKTWEMLGQPKIVLKIDGESNLINLGQKAANEGLICATIRYCFTKYYILM